MDSWRIIENPPLFIIPPVPLAEASERAWHQLQQQMPLGTVLSGEVFAQAVFGVFFDAHLGFPVRMNITDFGFPTERGMQFPTDYPALRSTITGALAGFDESNHQVVVSRFFCLKNHQVSAA